MQDAGQVRRPYARVARWIQDIGLATLEQRRSQADALFRRIGVTFDVFHDEGVGASERQIPFDLIPRVFDAAEWARIERGAIQRARALNAFLSDVYGNADIVRAGRIPRDLVFENDAYLPLMKEARPARGVYCAIVGVDVVRTSADTFFVLEDNCRTPSGASNVLENRAILSRMFPELFEDGGVRSVADYPDRLRRVLEDLRPDADEERAHVALLTPGPANGAFYEHVHLADEMDVELVHGPDLYVDSGRLWMRTTRGPKRVDILYRRVDDPFLDPLAFRKDSLLGIPGLMEVYLKGGVTLVNAPGVGVADDKAVYAFVPDMIDFYLGETPILPNVETWRCREPDHLTYVLENLDNLVVKEVHGVGGRGMLIGPEASAAEKEIFRDRVRAKPQSFVAQPVLELSVAPTLVNGEIVGRHVDFRPFVLCGEDCTVIPGGLTRASRDGDTLSVSLGQGGGVKDTWVLDDWASNDHG